MLVAAQKMALPGMAGRTGSHGFNHFCWSCCQPGPRRQNEGRGSVPGSHLLWHQDLLALQVDFRSLDGLKLDLGRRSKAPGWFSLEKWTTSSNRKVLLDRCWPAVPFTEAGETWELGLDRGCLDGGLFWHWKRTRGRCDLLSERCELITKTLPSLSFSLC